MLGVFHGGELAGGVALYESPSRHGTIVSPRLLLSYNGIVLRRYETRYPSQRTSRHLKILSCLVDALAYRGYARITLNCRSSITDVRPFQKAGWTASPCYTYIVPIADLDLLWSRIAQNIRRLIRRCENEGMSVSDDEDFGAFYRMHENTMKLNGHRPYLPEAPFRRYFETLRAAGLCRLFHARLSDGRPISTQLVLLGPHPVTHTITAGMDPGFRRTGAAAFLRWRTFQTLSASGYYGNDLTGAGLNSVTRFKSQLGGDLHLFLVLDRPPIFRYRIGTRIETWYRQNRASLEKAVRCAGWITT